MIKKIRDLTEEDFESLDNDKVITFSKDKEVGIVAVKDLKNLIDTYENGEIIWSKAK